jgi:hypothetical protein
MEAAHAEDKAALMAEFEALKAVVVSALGEEGVAEALGRIVVTPGCEIGYMELEHTGCHQPVF